jgi:hypothetical protein
MDPIPANMEIPAYIVGTLLSALGLGKGGQVLHRKYKQRNGNLREPLTRDELHDELDPLINEQRDATQAINRLATATEAHHSWMRGYMEGQKK